MFVALFWIVINCFALRAFKLTDYSHYVDYLPFRQEPLLGNDFRTATAPQLHLRGRKMNTIHRDLENVLNDITWPSWWPYSFEDFRPIDYTRDEVTYTEVQYEYSQSLIESDYVTIIPGILRIPIQRHFISPKDKLALSEHLETVVTEKAKVLELFSCYESILPRKRRLGPKIGIGWYDRELQCNPDLDDYIVQDVSVDPYLPLADNYFDIVIIPALFQLVQKPLELFQEINRVLKPGGVAVVGVKLSFWSFLVWKQCRYYVETNYLEDIVALGSFFHYASGFSKPKVYDLNYPEITLMGKIKDTLCPNPRLDFYVVVQARKSKDSPHGKETKRDLGVPNDEGNPFKPRTLVNYDTNEYVRSPYY